MFGVNSGDNSGDNSGATARCAWHARVGFLMPPDVAAFVGARRKGT
jgi:hypothetical protein